MRDIVVFPLVDWKKCEIEGFRTRDAHLIKTFGNHPEIGKILVIDRPISLPEIVIKRRPWQISGGETIYQKSNVSLKQVSKNIYVLDIFVFDLIKPLTMKRRWWADIFSRPGIHQIIQDAIHALMLTDYHLMLFSPLSTGVIDQLNLSDFSFFAVDNWLQHPQMQQAKVEIEAGYQKAMHEADLIVTTAQSLRDYFAEENKNTHFIPNGVDPSFFQNSFIEKPLDLSKLEGPIVGYAGKIQQRIDIDLMSYLSEALPEAQFVFIGQILDRPHFNRISQFKNIHYFGDKRYDDLPNYLKYFDVCIIPHVVSELTHSMSPLKLYEYLAAGKPIVSTSSHNLETETEWIHTTNDHSQFAKAINQYLEETPSTPFQIPEDWTWKAKGDQIVSLIAQLKNNEDR